MIDKFVTYLIFNLMGFDISSKIAHVLHFFIYDTTKILLLLIGIILLMGTINSYFPVDKIRDFLSRKKLFGMGNLLASLLGAITPFCSCSSIPLFIGFLKGGIPLGVTLSFLITSPLVNEVAIAIFWGVFGIKVTVVYAISGILLGTFVGMLLGKLKLEYLLEDWVKKQIAVKLQNQNEVNGRSFKDRVPEIIEEAKDIFKRVVPYVLIGIFVGALIHGYVPTGYFEKYIGKENLLAVPIATILAIPMYTNASGVIPVIQSLVNKGIPLGTALAFMMGVVGLSFPEALLLKKVMKLKLIFIYFFSVAVAIITIGYMFNFLF